MQDSPDSARMVAEPLAGGVGHSGQTNRSCCKCLSNFPGRVLVADDEDTHVGLRMDVKKRRLAADLRIFALTPEK